MRHDPGSSPHQFAYGAWQRRGTRTLCLISVSDFVVTHGFDDGPAPVIVWRQALEVTL